MEKTLERVSQTDIINGTLIVPGDITKISNLAFQDVNCESIKTLYLPKKLKDLNFEGLYKLTNLNNIIINNNCITKLDNLKLLPSLNKLTIVSDGTSVELPYNKHYRFKPNSSKGLLIYFNSTSQGAVCLFKKDDKLIKITNEYLIDFFDKQGKAKMNGTYTYDKVINIYHWCKKNRFLPSNVVIYNMPLNMIDNYYINNNCKVWGKLIQELNVNSENIEPFFKCCLTLGIFDTSSKTRDRAYDYITNTNKLFPLEKWVNSFRNCNTEKFGFRKEFAEFYLRNCQTPITFLTDVNDEKSYVSDMYNNLNRINKIYANKVIKTNRRADLLTEIMVISALKDIHNQNQALIDSMNEEAYQSLASTACRYGYSASDFVKLEQLFIKASERLSEFNFEPVRESTDINFELLNKLDPISIALGDITNCCQKLGDRGEECMSYGVTEPNSCFLVFRRSDTILGQSWVWFDKIKKVVCLDNIEVPYKIVADMRKHQEFASEVLECIERACKYVYSNLNAKGFNVKQVTIGKGFNSLNEFLSKKYEINNNATLLTGYHGYTDAREQYVVFNKDLEEDRQR